MTVLHFHVPGQPVGKGRPRIGKVGNHARMFTPAKTVNYESLVAYAAQQAMAGAPLFEGAVGLMLKIDCQIPASWSGKKQREAAAGLILPTTKPDGDNILKAICDALNGVAWKDDVQVCDFIIRKRYSMTPGVAVRIEGVALEQPVVQGELLGVA